MAVRVATVFVFTANVLMVNFAEVAPTGTVTDPGMVVDFEDDDSFTTIPPLDLPGAELRVTVPLDGVPPRTDEGFTVIDSTSIGCTVNVAVWVTPLHDAEMVTI